MAYADNTLNGLIQLNNKNLDQIEVSDLLQNAPLMNVIFTKTVDGTLHEYVKETVAAGSAFRAIDDGVTNTVAQTQLVQDVLKFMDASFGRDIAVAKGYAKGVDAYMAMQAQKALKAAFFNLEKQLLYGTGNDANGFTGIANTLDNLDDSMVINATGTESGTIKTSVFLIRAADEDIAFILGSGGNVELSEVYKAAAAGSATGTYTQLRMDISGYVGMQMGSIYIAGRIVNITNESGKGLTDDLIATALSKFPSGRGATHIVMNRDALAMLRDSRTATNATGAPAPFPTDSFGFPIVVTDAVSSAESLVTT